MKGMLIVIFLVFVWGSFAVKADDQLKRVLKAQEELNQLNRTLKQVEEYNEVMKSEIAVTRRTTYRAEESVVNLEKQKKG